jgi:hypothetical protein
VKVGLWCLVTEQNERRSHLGARLLELDDSLFEQALENFRLPVVAEEGLIFMEKDYGESPPASAQEEIKAKLAAIRELHPHMEGNVVELAKKMRIQGF